MRNLIVLLIFFCASCGWAQQPDSLAIPLDTLASGADTLAPGPDTTGAPATVKKNGFVRRIFTKDYPNPKTAVFLSLALPGAGQAYNKRWWKLPIVYGVLGGITYFEIDNIREYKRLRDNYKWVVDGDPNTNPTESPYDQLDATSLKQYRDQWRRYVEQTSLFLGLAYILTATEAFVDAHLRRFDVSDDLSFRVQPKLQASPTGQPVFGLGLALQFGKP
ncbi:MAG: hypothetical protein H6574_03385 [Lewinellaceae bacterium]|nr:hypothetical protein [Lewinellaceae bacterium]MCB9330101.1 hypothetical protein [Lewinellaceae bacterium]